MWIRISLATVSLTAISVALGACDGDTYSVQLVNDTQQAVEFEDCLGDNCDDLRHVATLDPGDSSSENATVDADEWWLVRDESGAKLGCVNAPSDERYPDYEVLASAVQGCPTD
jgi:hypothetical protein